MARVCARPGCQEPAVATFVFSTAELSVTVGDLTEHSRSAGHDLCDVHANRLSVPMGWTLTDERTARGRLTENPSSPMLARAFRSAAS